jgi:TonB family protein
MFETLLAVTSPGRSRLAGPAAALAHGLAFAGLVGAAYWSPGEPDLPDPSTVCFPLVIVPGGGGGGGHSGGPEPRTSPPRRVKADVFPNRLPERTDLSESNEPEIGSDFRATTIGPIGEGPERPDGPAPGNCPDCPVGSPGGGEGVYRPGGKVVSPILVHQVDPVYPEPMRKARQEGVVVLEAVIERDGSIRETRVVSATNGLFEEASLQAVRQWRYRAGTLNSQAVRVVLQVVVTFRVR